MADAPFSDFQKKLSEETAKNLFQLVWGWVQGAGSWAKKEAEIRKALQGYAENFQRRHGEVKVLGMSRGEARAP